MIETNSVAGNRPGRSCHKVSTDFCGTRSL